MMLDSRINALRQTSRIRSYAWQECVCPYCNDKHAWFQVQVGSDLIPGTFGCYSKHGLNLFQTRLISNPSTVRHVNIFQSKKIPSTVGLNSIRFVVFCELKPTAVGISSTSQLQMRAYDCNPLRVVIPSSPAPSFGKHTDTPCLHIVYSVLISLSTRHAPYRNCHVWCPSIMRWFV